MKSEIIAVGTELLMGQVVNTNATDISRSLHAVNIPVFFQSVVGDNQDRLIELLKQSSQRSQLIVLCGGIGPTEDDMTKQALSVFLDIPLCYDSKALHKIEKFFETNNRVMTENNKRQALILEGATVLPNEVGLAIGCMVEKNGVKYVVLPGPPHELKAMLKNSVEPLLTSFTQQTIYSQLLRFANIGEAKLADIIQDVITQQTNPTIAIYANVGLVDVRISASAPDKQDCIQLIQPVKDIILKRLNQYFYGIDEDTLSGKLITLLQQTHQTISVAESFTGGLFQSFLVNTPGASQVFYGGYVTYNDEAKITQLGVPKHVIDIDGVYSEQCAIHMARQVKEKCQTSIGVSFTGLAGNEDNTMTHNIFIGIVTTNEQYVIPLSIKRERNMTRQLAVYIACQELIKKLEDTNGN